MGKTTDPTLGIKVRCRAFPGLRFEDPNDAARPVKEPVWLGVQRGEEVIQQVPADRKQATFTVEFGLVRRDDGRPDFRGPYAKGKPEERFFYLAWGVKGTDGAFDMFRRLKVHLSHLTLAQCEAAVSSGRELTVSLRMTDRHGGPVCATPAADLVYWGVA